MERVRRRKQGGVGSPVAPPSPAQGCSVWRGRGGGAGTQREQVGWAQGSGQEHGPQERVLSPTPPPGSRE